MRRIAVVSLVVALLSPFPLAADTLNLRDLLADFLRQGIILAPPPPASGFPSHEAHFIGDDSPQLAAVRQFSGALAAQLASFPLPSSAGGFTYEYDPSLGVLTRAADNFGPVYAERANTIGRGKFNVGVNFTHFSFEELDGLDLRGGDLRLVFSHIDVNNNDDLLNPFFEGDVITGNLSLKVESDITAFVMTYGVTDRFDVGAAIPLVSVDMEVLSDVTVQRLATSGDQIHVFPNGTDRETLRQSGNASGVGDVVLRGKLRMIEGQTGGLAVGADVRLPTGEERDLLGTGATQIKGSLIGSLRFGGFSPHLNAGYTSSSSGSDDFEVPDEWSYAAGFDWAIHPRMTFAVDVLGRTFIDSQNIRVEDTTFSANLTRNPTAPPNIVTATFPQLVTDVGDVETMTGSVGVKINPAGNLLITLNGLFSLGNDGLQSSFAPLVAVDYSF
jgi:hypothetical protein